MPAKERNSIQDMLNNAPEEMTTIEFAKKVAMITMAMEGVAQWQRGESVSFEEAQKRVAKWM